MAYYNTTSTQNYPLPGPNSVSEYLVSAIPWVTSSNVSPNSLLTISFDNVTSFFLIKNLPSSGQLKVAFTENGFKTNNFFTLNSSEGFSADLRIKNLFLSSSTGSSFEIIAGVTTIPSYNFPTLTGSNNPAPNSIFVPNIG